MQISPFPKSIASIKRSAADFVAHIPHILFVSRKKASLLRLESMAPLEDRLGSLPDSILCSILSRMELRFAVRCSVLSKRWKYLYTNLPRLKFYPTELLPSTADKARSNWIIDDIISNVLLCHSGDLEGFSLDTRDSCEWVVCPIKLSKWVRYAALHNLQHLSLGQIALDRPQLPLDTFNCKYLKSLYVSFYDIDIPPDFAGFRFLTHCYLFCVNVEDPDSLVYFISKCPVLQHLHLEDCVLHSDLGKLTISAPNLQTLRVIDDGYWEREDVIVGTLTLNCPNLLHFTLKLSFPNIRVKCNRILIDEFSNRLVSAELTSNGDLIELEIFMLEEETEDFGTRFVDIIGSFQTLIKLKLLSRACIQSNKFPLITRILQRLPGLEALSFTTHLTMRDQGPKLSLESGTLTVVYVEIEDYSAREISLLDFLLKSIPSLKIMTIEAPSVTGDKKYIEFLHALLHLPRASPSAKIKISHSKRSLEAALTPF